MNPNLAIDGYDLLIFDQISLPFPSHVLYCGYPNYCAGRALSEAVECYGEKNSCFPLVNTPRQLDYKTNLIFSFEDHSAQSARISLVGVPAPPGSALGACLIKPSLAKYCVFLLDKRLLIFHSTMTTFLIPVGQFNGPSKGNKREPTTFQN